MIFCEDKASLFLCILNLMKIATTKCISINYFIKLIIGSFYPITAKQNLCSQLKVNLKRDLFLFMCIATLLQVPAETSRSLRVPEARVTGSSEKSKCS